MLLALKFRDVPNFSPRRSRRVTVLTGFSCYAAPPPAGSGRGGTGAECTIEVVVRPCGVNRSSIGS